MHIPDGFLSPQTAGILGLGMLPVWAASAAKTAKNLKIRQVPLLSLGAAFAFVIMMFNIPLPNGTTLHPVGGALLAVILGPWAATIGITIALVIQALFFGDGGLMAIGANSFNMAFAMSFSAYWVYKLISGRSELTSRRRWIAAAAAAYISLNITALLTAVELGLQPLLFQAADGKALYFPYSLSQAVPAISFAHLLVGGPAEAIVTAMVVRYFQKANQPLLALYPPGSSLAGGMAGQAQLRLKKVWGAVIALVLLSPLGVLATGTAWGEWSPEELKKLIGYVPEGIASATGSKFNLLPDYTLPGLDGTLFHSSAGYIVSAAAGLAIIFAAVYLFNKFQPKGEKTSGLQ